MSEELVITLKDEGAGGGVGPDDPNEFQKGSMGVWSQPWQQKDSEARVKQQRQREQEAKLDEQTKRDTNAQDMARGKQMDRRKELREESLNELDSRRESAPQRAQEKNEDFAAKQQRQDEAHAERVKNAAEVQQVRDEDFIAKLESRQERADERTAKRIVQQQLHDEDYAVKQERREEQAAERTWAKMQKDLQKDEKEAEGKKHDWAGPFAPTVKRYAQMGDAFFGKKAPDVAQGPPPPGGGPPGGGPPGAGAAGAGTAMAEAAPMIGAAVVAVQALASAAGGIEKVADLGLAAQKNAMQGGPHQTSSGLKIGAQAESATVDWIPIVGPALGKVASFGTEMASKAIEAVENVAVQAADNMRTTTKAMTAVTTFDSKAFAAQMGDLAEKRIPIFGTVVNAATDSVLQMASATETVAKRLGEYDGRLASQNAEQEVALIMREISRAQKFGGDVAATNNARFQMEQKMGELTDTLMPAVLKAEQAIFIVAEGVLSILKDILTGALTLTDSVVQFLQVVGPPLMTFLGQGAGGVAFGAVMGAIHRTLQEMQNAATPAEQNSAWTAFFNAGIPGGIPATGVVPPAGVFGASPMPAAPTGAAAIPGL